MTSYGSNSLSAFSDDSGLLVRLNVDVRVDGVQAILRRRELRAPDVRRAVDNLPLQVAEVDDVEIDDADRADAGRGQIHRGRRAEAAGADAQHAAGLQPALPVHADLRHDQVAAVALDLVVRELRESSGSRARLEPVTNGRSVHAARDRRNDADRVGRASPASALSAGSGCLRRSHRC